MLKQDSIPYHGPNIVISAYNGYFASFQLKNVYVKLCTPKTVQV